MEHETQVYGVYVQTDAENRIISINSDDFLPSLDGWVKIDEGYGDRYRHAQGNYFPQPIRDGRGICRYKLVDRVPEERTQEEMSADYVPPIETESVEERVADIENAMTALMEGIANA